jgi:hypothetical protein
MNYADQARRFFDLEKQEQLAIEWRTDFLHDLAERSLAGRMKNYPRSYRRDYAGHLEQLHRDLCDEDLVRTKHIGMQRHYLRLAQAYAIEAQRLGHVETGAVFA